MEDPRAALRLRVVPGLVLICILLALYLYQNALLLRLALGFRGRAIDTEFASSVEAILLFDALEIIAAFAGIALLALVRRPFVPFAGVAVLLFCGYPGYCLQNLILSLVGPGRPIFGQLDGWGALEIAITIVGMVWLLKSRNVRDFFDRRLVARTFD